jgi:hypothetical protein
VTPQALGAHGDAKQIANGCTTTTTSTTVVCPSAPFVTGDVGKELWVTGAGASGVAFGATISTVVSNTTVTVASTPSTTVTQNQAVFGHDDVAAIQDCFNYSSLHGVQCVLGTATPNNFLIPAGYLVASSGLLIPTHANITGSSFVQGTTLFAEYNGDLLSLPTGTSSLYAGQPVQGVNIANLELYFDPSQPNGRGIHLNAAVGLYSFGGMYSSTFSNIQVENAAQECLWLDGGGGEGYKYNLPNQYITFNQMNCNGPNQQHNAAEILATGQNAQILFLGGAINGVPTDSYYPNPLISIHEKTRGMNDAPVDIKFYGFTYETGTKGLYVSQASNIHYDNGYVENIASPLYATNTSGITYNGNHIANSGTTTAVAQYAGNVNGSFRDNYVSGSSFPAALGVCQNTNAIDFQSNVSPVTKTSGCATIQQSISSSTLTVVGSTEFINPSATPVSTIIAPNVAPGKTLTLYAAGAFILTSGGNINFGGQSAPLTIPAGHSVTLTLYDLGPTWLVTATTAGGAAFSAPIGGMTPNSPNFSTVNTTGVQTAAGPNSSFFDDFYTGANIASDPIGSPKGDTCSTSDTYTDNNHPESMLLTAGTGGMGTGIVCGLLSENPSITSANTSQAWTWETAVYVPVLPGTTAGAYQVGMAHSPKASPWTTGIGFYLSSTNGVRNDWYCRYNSISTDSGVAATTAWTRLTMVNDGTNVHWYIGGRQVCGSGAATANMPLPGRVVRDRPERDLSEHRL